MRTAFFVAFIILASFSNLFAQNHFEVLPMVVADITTARQDQFLQLKISWNMPGDIQADLNDGINYLLERKLGKAQHSFDIVLSKDQNLWQALYYRAIIKRLQENYGQALYDLQRAIKLNPAFYEAHIELAKCHEGLNAVSQSEVAIHRAIEIDTNRPEAYYYQGFINQALQKNPAAIASFQKCLETDSTYLDAHVSLALNWLGNRNQKKAIEELTSALRIDSMQKDALMLRSILLFNEQRHEALSDLNNLLIASPTNIIGYYLRGMLWTRMRWFDRAFADFQKVIKATSTDENNFQGAQTWIDKKIDIQNVGAYTLTRLYGLRNYDAEILREAYCLIILGAYDQSLFAISRLSKHSTEPLAVYLTAVAFEHGGKHRNALEAYEDALRLDSTIVDAYKKIAIYAQELKQWDASIKGLTKVLRLMPEAFVIYKIRGLSYHHQGNYAKAIADYTTYLKYDSTNKEVMGFRGVSFQESNQRLFAYIDFGNSNNPQAFMPDDMMHLVDSVLNKGDTLLALKALKSFVKAAPNFTEAYALKLRLNYKRKEWNEIENGVLPALDYFRDDAARINLAYLLTLKATVMSKSLSEPEALDMFQTAIAADKKNAVAYLERGRYLINQKKFSKATSDLKKAASLGNDEANDLLKLISSYDK